MFDKITADEMIKLEAFQYLWEERNLVKFSINKDEGSICICKIDGKWVTYKRVNNFPTQYLEFGDLDSLIMYYFGIQCPQNEAYCLKRFNELVEHLRSGKKLEKPQYVKETQLECYEQNILNALLNVLKESGDLNRSVVYPLGDMVDELEYVVQFYKVGDKWVVYTLEQRQRIGYKEYDDIYPMCFDIFGRIDQIHRPEFEQRLHMLLQQNY